MTVFVLKFFIDLDFILNINIEIVLKCVMIFY
jgi:hypothetical protein